MIVTRTITLLILSSFLVAAPAPAPASVQGSGGLLVERAPPWGSGPPPWWPGGRGGAKGSKGGAAPPSGVGGGGSDAAADTGTQTQAQAGSQPDTGGPPQGGRGGWGGVGKGGVGKGGSGSGGDASAGSGSTGSAPDSGSSGGPPPPPPPPASAPSGNPSSGGGGGGGYMSTVTKWRSTIGMSALTQDSKLEANAQDTSASSGGKLKHKLNPGSMAQVMAPGNSGNFESVFVGGWLCERPNLPGLSSVCGTMSKGWNHAGQVGHADILSSAKYKKIGCALASGIWTCDLA